eukprot:Gb_10930 [translate_table: standard]
MSFSVPKQAAVVPMGVSCYLRMISEVFFKPSYAFVATILKQNNGRELMVSLFWIDSDLNRAVGFVQHYNAPSVVYPLDCFKVNYKKLLLLEETEILVAFMVFRVAVSTQKVADTHIPNYPNLPPQLICQLHNVTLHADVETDEVYAQMTLQPVNNNVDGRGENLVVKLPSHHH